MQHSWHEVIFDVAADLDQAGIPYSFEASTALLLQGLITPEMDDVDVSVQWSHLEAARSLFAPDHPTSISHFDGWAKFRFDRLGVPVDVLSYMGTEMATDPDRVAVLNQDQRLWCKSLAFFYRHYAEGHPRRQLIADFLARRGGTHGP